MPTASNDNDPWSRLESLKAETAAVITKFDVERAMREWKPRLDVMREDILLKASTRGE